MATEHTLRIDFTITQEGLNLNATQGVYPSIEDYIVFDKWYKGDTGDDGKSAYEIWLEQGHTGTEEDFLEWLKADSVQSDWEETDTDSLAYIKHKPQIPAPANNAMLHLQRNGTQIGTFSSDASSDETINIAVPTTASDVSALPDSTKYAKSISLSINSQTYVMTAQLKDQNGNNLSNAQSIDLPLESVVVGGYYDDNTKKVILTLQNGNTIEFSVADLVSGLQSEITVQNPLSADLLTNGSTNKVYTATEQSKLSGIEAGAEVNVQSDWDQSDNTKDNFIKNKPSLAEVATSGDYDDLTNKPTIPAAQVNSDWNANSGVSEILYKPAIHNIPAGGNAGQVLKKTSATDYDVNWANASETLPSAYCTTSGSTAAKKANCSLYALQNNQYLQVLIGSANTYQGALTLNINSAGAKPIYINGTASSSSNYTLPNGTYFVFYDGTNYYFRTDGKLPMKDAAFGGSYNDLADKPASIPTPTSEDEGKLLSVNASGEYELITIVNSENIAY